MTRDAPFPSREAGANMKKQETPKPPPAALVSLASSRPRPRKITAPNQWDGMVLRENGNLLQSWRWGEFKKQAGWSPVRLLIAHSSNEAAAGPPADGANPKSKIQNPKSEGPAIGAQVMFRRVPRMPIPVSLAYVPRGPI